MAKKNRSTGSADDQQLADAVRKSAQQIWQAGLGAFAKAQSQGGKAFARLVKDGTSVQKKSRKAAGVNARSDEHPATSIAATLGHQAAGTWDKLEQIFEERVARSLAALGIPGQQQFDQLTEEVAALRKALARLSGAAVARPKRTSPAASANPAPKAIRVKRDGLGARTLAPAGKQATSAGKSVTPRRVTRTSNLAPDQTGNRSPAKRKPKSVSTTSVSAAMRPKRRVS
ncbi:MAG: phasin family protein [Pseudomonadota bacterium]|nr:phasin family protein [Pseudomonadota bacterium]